MNYSSYVDFFIVWLLYKWNRLGSLR
jgi:hypothetical protein